MFERIYNCKYAFDRVRPSYIIQVHGHINSFPDIFHGKLFVSIDVGNNWLSIPKEHCSFLQHMHRVFSIPAGTVLLLLTLCWLLVRLRCDLTYFNIPSGHRPVQQHFIHTGSNTYSHGMYSSSDSRSLGLAVIHVTYLFTIAKYWNSSDVIVCFCYCFFCTFSYLLCKVRWQFCKYSSIHSSFQVIFS